MMTKSIENILNVVCEVCDIDTTFIKTRSRQAPLPTLRGFFWYAVRKATGYSNSHIANITASDDTCHFTGTTVGIAINKTLIAISKEAYWRNCWEQVAKRLNLLNILKQDEQILIRIIVPKGKKNNINVEIKEQANE